MQRLYDIYERQATGNEDKRGTEIDAFGSEEVPECLGTGCDETEEGDDDASNPTDTSGRESNQAIRISLQFENGAIQEDCAGYQDASHW